VKSGDGQRRLSWLASYPKSGNTWARAFLRAYQFDAYEPVDINQIGKISCSESRLTYFQAAASTKGKRLSNAEVDSLRRPVQERLARQIGRHQVVKTHNARLVCNGFSLIHDDLTRCAVYLVRNPLDVVDSFADHNGVSIDEAIGLMSDPAHRIGGPNQEFVTQYLSTWSTHVRSWIHADDFPVLIIRYEDLLLDSLGVFRQLIQFLGWHFDEGRLTRAVRCSSFNALRQIEGRQGFQEVSAKSRSGKFFRRGQSGAWTERLSENQRQRLVNDHGETMQLLGYRASHVSVQA